MRIKGELPDNRGELSHLWVLSRHWLYDQLERTEDMQARIKNPALLIPGALDGLRDFGMSARTGEVSDETLALVQLRVSQINGCSVCCDIHSRELEHMGASSDRLHTLAAWRETPYFSDPQRAALALAEATTRVAQDRARHRGQPGHRRRRRPPPRRGRRPRHGVRANSVAPGAIRTPLLDGLLSAVPAFEPLYGDNTPIGASGPLRRSPRSWASSSPTPPRTSPARSSPPTAAGQRRRHSSQSAEPYPPLEREQHVHHHHFPLPRRILLDTGGIGVLPRSATFPRARWSSR